ncbi:LacI family DNA-binding transcriptional regulator [Salipaludibacillus daqingensis]|uniref:LacI family DNA-binding transcriptional regulator n=1 Tax=Salipaludibacillus daqingensis TaxID=3041001 RepID=UPI002473EB51|nr:LacI family DNA-binding transcriptional regulator [Salipaludibacillus daqingensis]
MEMTIKDVARIAGVSVSTVSRVLNGKDRVNPETRRQVLEKVKELNYVPNNLAVSMVKKKTKIIAVVVPEILNPFYAAVVKGTEEIAKSRGYVTLILLTNDNEKEEKDYYDGILNKYVDGIILVGSHKNSEFYQSIEKPTILVDRYIENSGKDGVVIDNMGGTYQLTEHLIENGHTDIAIINGIMDFNDGRERFWGFKQAMSMHNIDVHEKYVKPGNWFEENGYQSTKELLQSDHPPSAILACNNLICIGAIKAIRDLDLKIGEDISLVGFDDHDLAQFNRPSVTVIDRPTYEMGTNAADMLIDQVEANTSKPLNPKKVNLSVNLKVRESVKNLNQSKHISSTK